MTLKNAWNKVYETVETTYKVKGEDGYMTEVTEKSQVLAKHGMKPNKLECEFSKVVRNMKADKPKMFTGDWTK